MRVEVFSTRMSCFMASACRWAGPAAGLWSGTRPRRRCRSVYPTVRPGRRRSSGPRREALVERQRRAVDAGQVGAGADLDAVADAVTGAFLHQLLTGNAAASERRAAALVDILLGGRRPTSGGS
ncbi:TetR/AcrR family transcriptional regulator C-terminal ligand-binding domain-containing protein [Streptomyces viridochromogenes]|uniref:TetR/AcrR family transcriptional regulator C-terminal ligand-binding domain-containing protein n=1 Tax=Streptomyces viridochromogenes TaxID=1938 RepID=UPI00099E0605